MNHYTFDEIEVGYFEEFSITITDEMISNFCITTGDVNPLHTDSAFAQVAGYDNKVAYGLLTASFMSTIAGVYLPGEHSLIQRIEAEFPAPVYVGDTVTFSGKVVSKDTTFRFIELKVVARNNRGKKVLRGKMQVGVLK